MLGHSRSCLPVKEVAQPGEAVQGDEWKMFGRELDYEEAVLSLSDTSPKVSLFTRAFVI